VKRRRRQVQLTERQQLIIALLLVILVTISLLYCLGLASLALRQAWRDTTLPWSGTESNGESIDVTPPLLPIESPLPATSAP
jgi:hypothetical protein